MKQPCERCEGAGFVTEFRNYAGEAMAGEPYEIRCDDCQGEGGFDATCEFCKDDAITELDGDYLCQRHADEWCEAEGLTETHGDPLRDAA